MEIEIRIYENTNGKSPRGYGLWIFTDREDVSRYAVTDDYAEAKKQAIVWAKMRGITKLFLKP